jgi:cell division protein ZapA
LTREVAALKNRVTVNIAGMDYTLLAEENADRVYRVAALVDEEIRRVSDGVRMTDTQICTLCALNLAERLLTAETAAENLRSQLKSSLDDLQKAQREASEAKRELSRLKNQR